MFALGLTLCLLSVSAGVGHETYTAEEMLKKVIDILDLVVKDKKCSNLCPDTWIRFHHSCYLFPRGDVTFMSAEHICVQHGSHLVHVGTEEENNFLKNQMMDLKESGYWIGLVDPGKNGTWRWYGTGAQNLFTDWSDHSPNNYGGNQYCVFMEHRYNFQWNDMHCTAIYRAVCEKNLLG